MTWEGCGNDVGVCGNGGGCVGCGFVGAAALLGGLRLGSEISPVYVIPAVHRRHSREGGNLAGVCPIRRGLGAIHADKSNGTRGRHFLTLQPRCCYHFDIPSAIARRAAQKTRRSSCP